MSETESALETVLDCVMNIEAILTLLLFEKEETLLKQALSAFGTSKKRAEVYLVLDGSLSATEIGNRMEMRRPNVSVEIRKLLDAGLIELTGGIGSPYRRRRCFELIGLPTRVAGKFGL